MKGRWLKSGRHFRKIERKAGFEDSMRAGMQGRAGNMAGVPLQMEMESVFLNPHSQKVQQGRWRVQKARAGFLRLVYTTFENPARTISKLPKN